MESVESLEEIKRRLHHVLKGKAIELIPATEEHLDFICDEESDSKLWCYEEDIETDKEHIRKQFAERIEDFFIFDFIVKRISDGAEMGVIYIGQYFYSRKSWEIGYVILPEFQGNGYCLESVRLLMSFAFNELEAHKVVGMCNSNNKKSASVMQKSGMSKQCIFREEYQCEGKWVDQFYFSILDREYRNNYR